MILSHEQQVLVAKLNQVRELPNELFRVCFTNRKTSAHARILATAGILEIDEVNEAVQVLDPFDQLTRDNGITDEFGELTELGSSLVVETIEESFQLFIKLQKFVFS